MTKPRGTPKRFKRIDVAIPPDLLHRLKLVRAITGIPMKEWVRWQLTIACDLELVNRPGAMWLRPASRIYRMNWSGEGEPIAVPFTVSQGGERVWIREIIPDFKLHNDDDGGLPRDERRGAIICDLSSDEVGHVEARNVVVAAFDVQPHAAAWQTGLGMVQARKERERRRRKSKLDRLRMADSGE